MKQLPSMTLLREVRARLFPDVPRDKQEKLAQEMNFKHKENIIYYENGQVLAQAAQRGWGPSILGDIRNPEQPALGDLLWAGS